MFDENFFRSRIIFTKDPNEIVTRAGNFFANAVN